MPCYVGQGLLKNTVQADLNGGRQVAGGRIVELEIHGYIVSLCKLCNVAAQCNTQTVVVQHRWMKSAGKPADFVDSLCRDFSQPMSLRFGICYVSGVLQSTQAYQKRRQQLASFVMQFARNPAPFLLLSRQRAL